MQPQAVTENIDAARRDSRLLRMAFRRARQAGDYRGALQASQLGDQMGLQVGTPVRDEAIQGLGIRRYQDKMKMNQIASGQLGSEPNRNIDPGMTSERNYDIDPGMVREQPGVGGYDFNQRVGSPLARPQTAEIETTPDQLRRSVMQRKWQMAKTTEEKDAITEQAAAQGLTSNPSAVQDALMRRRKLNGPSETIPLRSNSDLGTRQMDTRFGVPRVEAKAIDRARDMNGRGVRQNPAFSPAADKAFDEQQAADKVAYDADIERQYQQKIAGLERLRPNYSKFQGDLERGYNETVEMADMTSSKVAGALGMGSLPPDETMRKTLDKSRANQRRRQFKTLGDFYGQQPKRAEFSDKKMQMDDEKENYLNNQRRRAKNFMLGPSGPLTLSRPAAID